MGDYFPKVRMCAIQGWGKTFAEGAAQQRSFWKPFGGLPVSSFMGQSWLFWMMTAFLPGIQVLSQPCHDSLAKHSAWYTLHLEGSKDMIWA